MATVSAQQFLKGGKIQLVQPASTNPEISKSQTQPGFLSRVGTDLQKRLVEGGQTIEDSMNGNNNPLTTGLQFAGKVGAGSVLDVIGEAFKSGLNAVPQSIKEPVSHAINKTAEWMVNNPTIYQGLNAANQGIDAYEAWKSKNPQNAKTLESVVNIAQLIPAGEAGSTAEKATFNGAEKSLKMIGDLGGDLKSKVVDTGENLLNKVRDVVTPLEDTTKTTLQDTSMSKFNKYASQAEKAITDIKQPTPMELAGQQGERALKSLQGKLKTIGEQKKAVVQSIADTKVGGVVDEARQNLRTLLEDRVGLKFGEKKVKMMHGDKEMVRVVPSIRNAKGRVATISDKADIQLLFDVDRKLKSIAKNPTFQKVDDAIDFTHDLLYKRSSLTAVPVNGKVEGILKNITKTLNDQLKEIGGTKYKNLNINYSNTKKVFDVLNKGLGVDGNKGAALMKQLFSPNGTVPRKLFRAIHDMTGIDLAEEASLAKYAMDRIGDVRQKSLLESAITGQSLPTSKGGIFGRILKYGEDKLQDPMGKARRIINRSGGKRK